ncbi:MAG: hypothetical protein RL210_1625 [Pseudomonadota bacterium]|jgi:ribosomal protein S18 acetylase RimI-like enzyme|nr:family N-acetyltransferase [Pseudomonadota bacterium]
MLGTRTITNATTLAMSPQTPELDPIIRACRTSELPTLAELARHIWQQHYPAIISQAQIDYMLQQRYHPAALQTELDTPQHWLDGLWLGETMLGFANYFCTGQPAEMKLDKLYLHPHWHGRGLGSLLLEYVTARARQHGCDTLTLAVNKHNTTAIKAYRRNGFEVAEQVVVDIGNGFVMDDFIMSKAL